MTKGSTSGFSIGSIVKVFAVADLVWAVILATLQSLVLNQAGVAIGSNGTATHVAAGATWITTFFVALFQGAIFEVFACIFAAIWIAAFYFLTKDADASTKKTFGWVFGIIALLDLGWAVLQGIQTAAVVAGVGTATAVHASGLVVGIATVLSFVVGAAIGLFTGTIFMTIFGAFGFVILMLVAFFSTGSKTGKTGGSASGGTTGDTTPTSGDGK